MEVRDELLVALANLVLASRRPVGERERQRLLDQVETLAAQLTKEASNDER